MHPLKEHIDRRLDGAAQFHDSAAFRRPEDVAGGELPAEGAGAAEPLGLVEIGLDAPALGVLGPQRLVESRLFLERALQLIARVAQRFLVALLCGAERDDEKRGGGEQDDTRNILGGDPERIGIDEKIGEEQDCQHGRQQAGTQAAEPGGEHDRTEEQRHIGHGVQEAVEEQRGDKRRRHRQYRDSIGENHGRLRSPRRTGRRHLLASPRLATLASVRKLYLRM